MAAIGPSPQTRSGTSGLCTVHVDTETGFRGGEVQVFLLLEGLRARGDRAVLVCRPGSGCAEEAARRGIEWVPIRMRNHLDLAAVPALVKVFREACADVVHLHTGRATWLGGLAARVAGLPALATRRMDRRVTPGWRTRLMFGVLVERVVAISPAVAAALAAGHVAPERIRIITSAVDPAALRPVADRATLRALLGASPHDQVLLALAALVHGKGLDLLLDALSQLARQGIRPLLWIAGSGPEQSALEAQVDRLGLRGQVRFLGQRRDTADLLAACDVFVTASREEGLGVAALEAMAAARPVVATAVGGLRETVVDGQTGLLVPPEDPRALADALGWILTDDALCERLAAAGPLHIARGFHADAMVAAYRALYQELRDKWRTR